MAELGASAGVGAGGATSGGGQSDGGGGGAASGVDAGSNAGGSSGAGSSGGSGSGSSQSAGIGEAAKGGQANWRDTLSDELKADPTLSKYSDVQNLAKAHIELQKKFGQKGVFKPGKDASAEEIKAFREQLGIPTDPAKYDMGKFEGVEVPEVTVQWAQKLGAEHGVEPAAMKTLMTEYFKIDAQNKAVESAAAKEKVKEGYAGLRKEWGDAFDRNLSRANFAAQKIGGTELVDRLNKLGVGDDPVILKAFSEAAKLYGEDKLREAGAGDGRETPQELEAAIAETQSRLFAMKPTDGAYLATKQKYESLWRKKTGGR